MNHNEFSNQMDRIVEVYGDKFYPTPRVEMIFKWAQRVNVTQFEAIVSRLIAECERPPLLQKFKELYSEMGFIKRIQPTDCNYCAGSGFIPDDQPLPTVYRCRCSIGETMPKFIKQWAGVLKSVVPTPAEFSWRNTRLIVKEKFDIK